MKISGFPNEVNLNQFEIKESEGEDEKYSLKIYGPPYTNGLGIEIYGKNKEIPKAVIRLNDSGLEIRTKEKVDVFDLKD